MVSDQESPRTMYSLRSTLGSLRAYTLLAAVCLVLIPEVRAQETTYTFSWRGTALDDALRELQTTTSISIVWLPLLAEGKRVYCVARNQPVEEILRCILDGTGLDFYRRSSGTYVVESAVEAPPLWGSMRGVVVDSGTRQPLADAHIYLAEAHIGRVANQSGMFAFDRLLPGEYAVRVSHMGYRPTHQKIVIEPGGSARPEIMLDANVVMIAPVVLEGLDTRASSTLLGAAMLDQEALTATPSTRGTLGGLDGLMGVRVNDATADIHIQGGDAGEHQFRLDGAPVYIPRYSTSFLGPFSSYALGTVRISKAGFGAPLGSHISGVIEAEHDLRYAAPATPDGTGFASRTLVQADPIGLNARFSGHAEHGSGARTTFMAAGRLGLWQLAAPRPLTELLDRWNEIDGFLLSAFANNNTTFGPYESAGDPTVGFGDLHLAGQFKSGLQTLGASVFLGRSTLGNDIDRTELIDPTVEPDENVPAFRDIYYWRSATAQVSYDAVLTDRALGNFQARFSRYRLRHDFEAPDGYTFESPEDDGNQIHEAALSGTIDYALTDRHYTEFGIELTATSDRFRIAGSQQLPINHRFTGWRAAGYAQDKIQLGDRMALELGSRFTYLHARRSLYAEPRVAARLDFPRTRTGSWSFYLGSGIYRQFVNQFDISSRSPRTFVSSTRIWMAVDSSVAPAKSGHLALELLWRPNARWSFTGEAHYKRHYHILSLDYTADTQEPDLSQREFLRSSRGRTHGYAAILQRSVGLGTIKARYEYTMGRRQISGLFDNRLMTVPWSEPHRMDLTANLVPIDNLVLLARWRLISGRTWGFRQAYYDFWGAYLNDIDEVLSTVVLPTAYARVERQDERYRFSDPESHRLPDLMQLDVGVGYSFAMGPVDLQTRLDVVNALGRTNVADWRFIYDQERYFGEGDGYLDRGVRDLLPRVTTFAVRVAW